MPLEAALSKNSPLPEPISSSTGWSLPKSSGQIDRRGLVGRGRVDQVSREVDRGSSAGHVGGVGFAGCGQGLASVDWRNDQTGLAVMRSGGRDQLGSAASPWLVMGTPMILP